MIHSKIYALLLLVLSVAACSTVTSPVLRHETGESLGPGHYRIYGRLETSRIYSIVPSQSAASEVAQNADVFQGTLLGVSAVAGVASRFDLQGGAFFATGGGGWRLGAKYQLGGDLGTKSKNNLATAIMAGYTAASGSGTITYLTNAFPISPTQSLAVRTFDISLPVSYRFSSDVAFYSGLNYFHSIAIGTADSSSVSLVADDVGINFGSRFSFGTFESDLEIAVLRIWDPFSSAIRYVPFFGVAIGVAF